MNSKNLFIILATGILTFAIGSACTKTETAKPPHRGDSSDVSQGESPTTQANANNEIKPSPETMVPEFINENNETTPSPETMVPEFINENIETTPSPKTMNPEIIVDWTIRTGDLKYIGVASDGTIYGVNENLYATLSMNGEIIQTLDLDLSKCLRPNFSGGAGAYGITDWFAIEPDGTIFSYAKMGSYGPCSIPSGGKPSITQVDGTFLPYGDIYISQAKPVVPDGFKGLISISSLYSWGTFLFETNRDIYFDFFLNINEKQAGFINRNGEFVTLKFEEDMNLERNLQNSVLHFTVTPWDTVFYEYNSYDGLGNLLGSKIIEVDPDGQKKVVNSIPSLITETPITYLPDQQMVYYIENKYLNAYDLHLNRVVSYKLPQDFPYQTTTNSNSISVFIGHDGALYIFKISDRTLTKYIIP